MREIPYERFCERIREPGKTFKVMYIDDQLIETGRGVAPSHRKAIYLAKNQVTRNEYLTSIEYFTDDEKPEDRGVSDILFGLNEARTNSIITLLDPTVNGADKEGYTKAFSITNPIRRNPVKEMIDEYKANATQDCMDLEYGLRLYQQLQERPDFQEQIDNVGELSRFLKDNFYKEKYGFWSWLVEMQNQIRHRKH